MQPPGPPHLNMEPGCTKACWPAGLRNNLCGLKSASDAGKGLDVKDLGVAQSSRASSRERTEHLSLEGMASGFSPGVPKNVLRTAEMECGKRSPDGGLHGNTLVRCHKTAN